MNQNVREYSKKEVLSSSGTDSDTYFKAFHALPMVQYMSKAQAMLLFSAMRHGSFDAGERVYQAGTATSGKMYMILSGKVNVSNESGHQYASLRAGEVFGLFSFLDVQRSHSANIDVERHIELLTLERDHFDLIDIEDPKRGRLLMYFMFQLLSAKALSMEVEYAHMHNFAFGGKV